MAALGDEHIRWLDVAVQNVLCVQVVHSEQRLCDVKGRRGLRDAAALGEHRGEVAAGHVLERKVDVVRRTERIESAHEELAVVLGQDGMLDVDRGDLVSVAQVLLAHGLDGHHVARRLLLGEPHLREAARGEHPDQLKVSDAQLARDGHAAIERARRAKVKSVRVEVDELLHVADLVGDDGLELRGARIEDGATHLGATRALEHRELTSELSQPA